LNDPYKCEELDTHSTVLMNLKCETII